MRGSPPLTTAMNPTDPDPATYQPISCDFHDLLEALATQRRPTTVHFVGEDGAPAQRQGVITDLYSRGGAEYLVLDAGEPLRLDRLVAVDGARRADFPE